MRPGLSHPSGPLAAVGLAVAWAATLATGLGAAPVVAQAPPSGATAEIRDATNRLLATANFRQGRGEVLISIVSPPQLVVSGTHALHIHDVGRCDPPDFATAGNIFNPFNRKHGRQNPDGAEVGDLPNVTFSSGSTTFNTTAIGATLGQGAGSLLNPSRSIVMDSGTDDQQTEPDGNSGARIGCGVITPTASAAATAPSAPGAAVLQATPAPTPAPSPARSASAVVAVGQPAQSGQAGQINPPQAAPAPTGAAPTPILVLPTSVPLAPPTQPRQSSGSGTSAQDSLIVAVLGLCLIGTGYLLRRRKPAT